MLNFRFFYGRLEIDVSHINIGLDEYFCLLYLEISDFVNFS